MGRRSLSGVLVALSLAAGCGGSPSSPSQASGTSNLAAESAIMTAMSQAMRQIALTPVPGGDIPNSFTTPCPTSGSMVITLGTPSPPQGNVYRSSSRLEYRDCRNQTVTLNGDPYLESNSEHSLAGSSVTGGDSVSTIRTTGGLRIDNGGVQGRVQIDCTMIVSIRQITGSSPQVSLSSTGTITFEQPIGSAPVVRPCGPA